MKKYASALLGLAVTVALLALALRNVSLAELAQASTRLDPVWLLPMTAVVFIDLLVRSWRWRFLLGEARGPSGAQVPFWILVQLEAIGLALNNVFFLRIGEFARGYLAGIELGVPGTYGMATVFVERALDIVALLTLFVVAAGAYPETVPAALRSFAGFGALALIGGLVAVSAIDRSLERDGAAAGVLARLPEKAQTPVRQLALGSRALRSPGVALAAAALSLALWVVDAGVYWMAGRAMGLVPALSYGRSVVVLSTAAAACAMPAAPGSFGAFEQFVMTLLVHWGVAAPVALAYAGIVHLLFYLLVTFMGLAFLYRLGHTFASLSRAVRPS